MGPGLRSCPSVQPRRYCCLGEQRQKVTKIDKWLYPQSSSGFSSWTCASARDPAGPVTPQILRPHSHRLPLLPALCSPRSHPAGSGPKPHIHPPLPISWLSPSCLSALLTCRAAPASPLPFVLCLKPFSQDISLTMSFPCFVSDGSPQALGSGTSSPSSSEPVSLAASQVQVMTLHLGKTVPSTRNVLSPGLCLRRQSQFTLQCIDQWWRW